MKKAASSSSLLLLDVNVLLAIAWPNHQFHSAAVSALARRRVRWATCALTELGFIRLSSNRAAIPTARSPAEAAAMLGALVADPAHEYLGELPSPASTKESRAAFDRLLGHRQVTDAYLLALARRSGATLVTFDKRVESAADPARIECLGE